MSLIARQTGKRKTDVPFKRTGSCFGMLPVLFARYAGRATAVLAQADI